MPANSRWDLIRRLRVNLDSVGEVLYLPAVLAEIVQLRPCNKTYLL